jgi:plasmid stabilization system protein ParE
MYDVLKPQRCGDRFTFSTIAPARGVIEIVRVLHERMEPSRHLDELPTEGEI